MKVFPLSKRVVLFSILSLSFLNFSFGQNATNGGTIGISTPDTVFNITYFVGDVADTIINVQYPSGGDEQAALEYIWIFGTSIIGNDPAPGINTNEYYIPSTDTPGNFFFIRNARRAGYVNFQAGSNIVTVEVLPVPVSTETLASAVVNIYPNPITKHLQIEFTENSSPNWLVEVFDIKGSLQKIFELEDVQNIQTIDLQNLTKGIYIVQLSDLKNNKVENFKIVKE